LRVISDRDRSLDVFRGATVALMILVNNPGSWSHLYAPLAHASWHGWTLTDLVFPFFLFAVGNALALTMSLEKTIDARRFWSKWLRRTSIIFCIGLFLNAAPFVAWTPSGSLEVRNLDTLRIMGVLQRIALCWAVAALVIRAGGVRAAWIASIVLLVVYWLACLAFAQGPDPYSLEGFFGTTLDRNILGPAHLYKGEGVPFDPEGLASTLPAIAQVLLGYIAGHWMLTNKTSSSLVTTLIGAAALLTAAGLLLGTSMPINKKLWTSTYVLLTSGLALAVLALLVEIIERRRQISRPLETGWRACEAFGRNALFIFALSGLVPRMLSLIRFEDGSNEDGTLTYINLLSFIHRELFARLADDPRFGSLLYAITTLLAYWAIAAFMQRHNWYIKV
jgi:predicted acyltransferase